jgi:hypothetical protein
MAARPNRALRPRRLRPAAFFRLLAEHGSIEGIVAAKPELAEQLRPYERLGTEYGQIVAATLRPYVQFSAAALTRLLADGTARSAPLPTRRHERAPRPREQRAARPRARGRARARSPARQRAGDPDEPDGVGPPARGEKPPPYIEVLLSLEGEPTVRVVATSGEDEQRLLGWALRSRALRQLGLLTFGLLDAYERQRTEAA